MPPDTANRDEYFLSNPELEVVFVDDDRVKQALAAQR
jgi:hypothetical protein